jgi:hypothetical protein
LLCFCHNRYCLWILGNGTTLLASNSIWADLVRDSKRRGCFFDAFKDKDLAEVVRSATKPEQWNRREQVFWNLVFCEAKKALCILLVRHVVTSLIVCDCFLLLFNKTIISESYNYLLHPYTLHYGYTLCVYSRIHIGLGVVKALRVTDLLLLVAQAGLQGGAIRSLLILFERCCPETNF